MVIRKGTLGEWVLGNVVWIGLGRESGEVRNSGNRKLGGGGMQGGVVIVDGDWMEWRRQGCVCWYWLGHLRGVVGSNVSFVYYSVSSID